LTTFVLAQAWTDCAWALRTEAAAEGSSVGAIGNALGAGAQARADGYGSDELSKIIGLRKRGKHHEAVHLLNAYLQRIPYKIVAWNMLADSLVEIERTDDAIDICLEITGGRKGA
jgi:predicted Zn-dependent protease